METASADGALRIRLEPIADGEWVSLATSEGCSLAATIGSRSNRRSPRRPVSGVASTPLRSVRRARLERLREETEPVVAEERREALRALLQHPLMTPEGSGAEGFALVRRHRDYAADWFAHAGGASWRRPNGAPAQVPGRWQRRDAGSGRTPRRRDLTRARYTLFCVALAVLERGDRQTTLGRLADSVAASLAADPAFSEAGFTWSLEAGQDRRDFVHALRLLDALGVLRKVDGDEERYLRDRSADVLYNVVRPVLAALLATRRSPSLVEEAHSSAAFGARRQRAPGHPGCAQSRSEIFLARHLLDDPVLYYDTLSDEARTYFDRQRGLLLRELADATGLEVELRAEGVALADLDGNCTDLGLPRRARRGTSRC